jgi:hypothetical protein
MLRHINYVHSFHVEFAVTCEFDDCQSTFGKFSSYKSHLYRKHCHILAVATMGNDANHSEEFTPADVVDDHLLNDEDQNVHVQLDRGKFLRESCAKFILKMNECLCLSQLACDEMVSGVSELFEGVMAHLHQSVNNACSGDDHELIKGIDGIFHDKSNISPFLELSTQYHQHKYFKENFGLSVSYISINILLVFVINLLY